MFEVFGCGNSSHFAVRFPVRVQALDDELGHLHAGGRKGKNAVLRKCRKAASRASPSFPFPHAGWLVWIRRRLVCQWDKREGSGAAPRGTGLPQMDWAVEG